MTNRTFLPIHHVRLYARETIGCEDERDELEGEEARFVVDLTAC